MNTKQTEALKLALEALEQARGALAYVAVGNATENPNLARSTCSHGVFKIDKVEPVIREALAEQPAQQQEPVAWRELCRRLYIELYWCDRQMMETLDEDGEPMWTQGKEVRDVLADAKAALETSPQPAQQQERNCRNCCTEKSCSAKGKDFDVCSFYVPPTPEQPAQEEPVAGVVIREGLPTLLQDRHIKPTDQRLYTPPPASKPVLWLVNGVVQSSDIPKDYTGCLFTSPPASKPLTDEGIDKLCPQFEDPMRREMWIIGFKAAHGIKEGGAV